MKVKANFDNGTSLVLTVEEDGDGVYYFIERNLCKWWWKEACEIIEV